MDKSATDLDAIFRRNMHKKIPFFYGCTLQFYDDQWTNWVFPYWLSANSVNHDQIQEQYGYQRHSISDNRYSPWYSSNKYYLKVGICSEWWVAIDAYPEVVMKLHFVLLALAMYLLPDG